jgi:hypothetical protein
MVNPNTENGAAATNTDNVTPDATATVVALAKLRLLTTPLVGDDPQTKALEATWKATLAAHL